MACLTGYAVLLTALFVLLPASEAQILPGVCPPLPGLPAFHLARQALPGSGNGACDGWTCVT